MDEVIKDEDKALILLSSFPDDDYETFILTLINDKKSLVNHELRDKKLSNNTSTEALTARGRSSNRKGKDNHERLKFKSDWKKNQYAFCKEEGH